MKQWVKKLVDQFDMDWGNTPAGSKPAPEHLEMNEDRATLLYLLDTYSKHLFEIESHSVRRARDQFDNYVKELVQQDPKQLEKTLFNLRQFFSSYRIHESTYVQSTFDDFKKIIWDFADNLAEDIQTEKNKDQEAMKSFEQLREAVESNSIDVLRAKSREFIDFYVKHQSQKDERSNKRMQSIRKNLSTVKKQLLHANHNMMTDHLTGAYNRRSFDEQMKKHYQMARISQTPVTLLSLDIDFFKKINDTYGHDIGDFILKECVRVIKDIFPREQDYIARVGGEEFIVILPDYQVEHAIKKAEDGLARIRKEVFIHGQHQIRFTVSMGIAQLMEHETIEQWVKRADEALYQSKQTGRNKYTISSAHSQIKSVAS